MAQSPSAFNILLVGKTGVGKSSTGNSILGREEFEDNVGSSVTKKCKEVTIMRNGMQITVIDTPGVCDTDGMDAAKVIDDYIAAKNCTLHAICLVMSPSRPTDEEKQAIANLSKQFGDAMLQYLLIMITTAENLDRKKVKPADFLKGFVSSKTDILQPCIQKGRVFGIDNFNDDKKTTQIQALFDGITSMVAENKGAMYTLNNLEQNKKKLEAEAKEVKEKKEQIKREKDEQIKKEREAIANNAREEERKKLEDEKKKLEEKEEALEKEKESLEARQNEHNKNAKRMGWLEAAGRGIVTGVGGMATIAGTTLLAAAALNPVTGVVAGTAAGVAATGYLITKLF